MPALNHSTRSLRRAGVGLALALTLAPMASATAATCTSVFTGVADGDCMLMAEAMVGRKVKTDGTDRVERCPAPKGHALYLVSDNARSWYGVEINGRMYSLEADIIRDTTAPGNFPNVATTPKVEWVVGPSGPVALVFRVAYVDRVNETKRFSRLHVYALGPTGPRHAGIVTTNAESAAITAQLCR
jgi:hypothetical protein